MPGKVDNARVAAQRDRRRILESSSERTTFGLTAVVGGVFDGRDQGEQQGLLNRKQIGWVGGDHRQSFHRGGVAKR